VAPPPKIGGTLELAGECAHTSAQTHARARMWSVCLELLCVSECVVMWVCLVVCVYVVTWMCGCPYGCRGCVIVVKFGSCGCRRVYVCDVRLRRRVRVGACVCQWMCFWLTHTL